MFSDESLEEFSFTMLLHAVREWFCCKSRVVSIAGQVAQYEGETSQYITAIWKLRLFEIDARSNNILDNDNYFVFQTLMF